jgi:hypothetical protein
LNAERHSEKLLWSTVGLQCSGNLEDHPCQLGSSEAHDGMNCIASSQAGDQTLDHHQQAERVLATVPLKSLKRRNKVSSNALAITIGPCVKC